MKVICLNKTKQNKTKRNTTALADTCKHGYYFGTLLLNHLVFVLCFFFMLSTVIMYFGFAARAVFYPFPLHLFEGVSEVNLLNEDVIFLEFSTSYTGNAYKN